MKIKNSTNISFVYIFKNIYSESNLTERYLYSTSQLPQENLKDYTFL